MSSKDEILWARRLVDSPPHSFHYLFEAVGEGQKKEGEGVRKREVD